MKQDFLWDLGWGEHLDHSMGMLSGCPWAKMWGTNSDNLTVSVWETNLVSKLVHTWASLDIESEIMLVLEWGYLKDLWKDNWLDKALVHPCLTTQENFE